MNKFVEVLLNKEVLTAIFGVITVLVMRYLNVPEEIWQSVVVLAGILIAKFGIDDLGETIGRSMARALSDFAKKKK